MVFYSHSIVTMAIFCIISEIKRDIGRKSQFSKSPAFGTVLEGNIGIPFCTKKTRMVWLTDGEKVEDTFSCFDRIPTGVPQTYRRTSCDVIVRAMHRIAR